MLLPSTQYPTEEYSHLLAMTHNAGATAYLLAEAEVPSVASEIRPKRSRPIKDFRVPNQEVYHGGVTASSGQILRARIVKNVEKNRSTRGREKKL